MADAAIMAVSALPNNDSREASGALGKLKAAVAVLCKRIKENSDEMQY